MNDTKNAGRIGARWVRDPVCGFLMALADSVPGVSGGTVAFMAGIYDDFTGSFGNITGKDAAARRRSIGFLLRLGIGWSVGMALSVSLLAGVFTDSIYRVSSLFFGLVAASVIAVAVEERNTMRGMNAADVLCLCAGAAAVVGLSMANFRVDVSAFSPLALAYVFLGGMLSISAMVLPGISGSTLLLAFGLYVPVITGIRDLMRFDLSAFPMLFVFGVGVLAGIAVSFRVIHRLITRNRRSVIYAVTGLMLGSLYAIVKGPTTLAVPKPPLGMDTFDWLFCAVGIVVIAVFEAVRRFAGKGQSGTADNADIPDDADDDDDDGYDPE